MRDVLTSEQVLSLLSSIVGEVSEHDESVVKFTPKRFDGDFEVVLSIEDLNFAVELKTNLQKKMTQDCIRRIIMRFSVGRRIDSLSSIGKLIDLIHLTIQTMESHMF